MRGSGGGTEGTGGRRGGRATLTGKVYVDPADGHTWQALPQVLALEREFAGSLALEYVVLPLQRPPLAAAGAPAGAAAGRPEQAARLAALAMAMGRPVALRLWQDGPAPTGWPAAAAWLAARRQGMAAANRYVLAQAEALMRQGRDIDRPEVLLELARGCGLDTDRLQAGLADPALAAELDALVAAARAAGIRCRPTLALVGAGGREYRLAGPRPYPEWRALAAAALAGAEAGAPAGTVPGEAGMSVGGRLPVPGGWRLELRPGGGRPGQARAPVYAAVRLFQPGGPLAPPAAAALLREAHQAGTALVLARGRDAAGGAVCLLGVRATAATPVKAGAAAGEQAGALQRAAAHLGVPLQEPGAGELRWLEEWLAAGEGPVAHLKWVPGPGRGDPCPPGLAPCGFLVLADPLPPAATQEEERRLRALEREWQQSPPGPDRDDSLAVLQQQLERVAAARQAGAWEVLAMGFFPAGLELAGVAALAAAWADPAALFPLRPVLVEGEAAAHLRGHAGTFTLCREREPHGAAGWTSQLATGELARYL